MSRWLLLKEALLGKPKTAGSSSLSIHRHKGFQLYVSKDFSEVKWQPVQIHVKVDASAPDKILDNPQLREYVESCLRERDLIEGWLAVDAVPANKTGAVVLNLSSSTSNSSQTLSLILSFEDMAEAFHIWHEYEVTISSQAAVFKVYETMNSGTVRYIYTRERAEGATTMCLKARLEGLCSNKLHGIDNTGNIRVWAAEQCLLFAVLNNSSIRHDLYETSVLELGSGLTGLLGLGLKTWNCCSYVHISDGHPSCVTNLALCAKLNKEQNPEDNTCTVNTSQLRWARGDPHGELLATLESLRKWSGQSSKKFDRIMASDCLFFTDFHNDLIWLLDHALTNDLTGRCYFLQPRRGGTMQSFIDLVMHTNLFDITVWEDYCPEISALHQVYQEDSRDGYDIDIHYPVMLVLNRKAIKAPVELSIESIAADLLLKHLDSEPP